MLDSRPSTLSPPSRLLPRLASLGSTQSWRYRNTSRPNLPPSELFEIPLLGRGCRGLPHVADLQSRTRPGFWRGSASPRAARLVRCRFRRDDFPVWSSFGRFTRRRHREACAALGVPRYETFRDPLRYLCGSSRCANVLLSLFAHGAKTVFKLAETCLKKDEALQSPESGVAELELLDKPAGAAANFRADCLRHSNLAALSLAAAPAGNLIAPPGPRRPSNNSTSSSALLTYFRRALSSSLVNYYASLRGLPSCSQA